MVAGRERLRTSPAERGRPFCFKLHRLTAYETGHEAGQASASMDEVTALCAIAVGALWILVAVALSLIAARRVARAGSVIDTARSMASLLEVAPARPLLVHPDGRIEADPRLLRELGLGKSPV